MKERTRNKYIKRTYPQQASHNITLGSTAQQLGSRRKKCPHSGKKGDECSVMLSYD